MKTKIKKLVNEKLSKKYPGSKVTWKKDDPTLIIPDELEKKMAIIAMFVLRILAKENVYAEFFFDKAVHVK